MKIRNICAASAALILSVGAASAATLVSQTFAGNDCSGFFGKGFGSCEIFINVDDEAIRLSPVIAKFDFDEDKIELNTAKYPSIDGEEFSFTESSSGTWTYSPEGDDPGVKYWAAKGGKIGFNLFWMVDDSAVAEGGACDTTNKYTLSCLSEALAVSTGYWVTPTNPSGDPAGLSHLTFYNTEPPSMIPLPAAGWLLLAGLGGLAAYGRKKRWA